MQASRSAEAAFNIIRKSLEPQLCLKSWVSIFHFVLDKGYTLLVAVTYFDIFDGVPEAVLQELLSQPCGEGLAVLEMLNHAESEKGDAKR